jgi:hypothetical protein
MNMIIVVLPYLIGLSLFAVLATLLFGLGTMTKGGDFNVRYGNKVMRLRVILQAVTIALFVLYFLLTRT